MNNVSIIVISIFLIFGAYLIIPGYFQYDSKRILQLGVLLLIGIFYLVQFIKKRDYLKKRFSYQENENQFSKGLLFIALVLLFSTALSVYQSNFPERAVVDVLLHLILILLSFLIAPKYLKTHHFTGRLIYAAAVLYVGLYIVVFAGNSISSMFSQFALIWPHKLLINGNAINVYAEGKEILYFVNRRFFNHTQTWTFPLLIGFIVYINRSKGYKKLSPLIFILISLWWMLLYQSGGRGTTLSVFVAAAFLWAVSRKDFTPLVKPLVISALAGWGLKYLLFDLPFSGTGESVLRTEHSRFYRIEGALEVWKENIWFGIGPGHYGEIGPTQFVGHPHNYYLQILSEWGVIAFVCISILFFVAATFVWKKFWETKPSSTNRLNFLVMSWSFIAACCHAFFSGVMHTPLSQMWLVLILAWFIGYYKREYNYNFKSYRIPVLAYVISLAIVLYIVIPEIHTLSEIYQAYSEQYPGRSLFPRFWGQGLFPVE